jgi:hypothetical protein
MTDEDGNEIRKFQPSKVDHLHLVNIKNYLKSERSLRALSNTRTPNEYGYPKQ